MQLLKLIFLVICLFLSGCVLTKIVAVPMRLGGAVVSVVPGFGNATDATIDTIADGIDDLPI